jgi:hypothetical protein
MGKGRKGGNPELAEHKFQPAGDESNNVRLNLWIPQSMAEKLQHLGKDKPNFVREAIATALKGLNTEED